MTTEDRLVVDLTDFTYLGEAIGRQDGQPIFAPGGIPGERVVVEISQRRSKFARGWVGEVLNASEHRVVPPCPYFGSCGGCQLQHVAYGTQLEWKTEIVRRQLRRNGGFETAPVRPIIPSAAPYNYRNNARFSVDRIGRLSFAREASHWLLPIDACLLMQEPIFEAMRGLDGHLNGLTQVVIRCSTRSNQTLISPRIPEAEPACETGQSAYDEILLGRRYRVSAASFFQVNTCAVFQTLPETIRDSRDVPRRGEFSQAEILALLVRDRLELTGRQFVLDAYSGVGTFAISIAADVAEVLGVDDAPAAVGDAIANADGLPNVSFKRGRSEDVLPSLDRQPDAVILDPSRVGCAPPVLEALARLQPRRIVYVSCDPATLARDLRILGDAGFELQDVQPLDMFPQTHHIEVVATLVR